MEFSGGRLDVVDPEVRAYVSSLVTAVSKECLQSFGRPLTRNSLEAVVQMKMGDMCWVTTRLHA